MIARYTRYETAVGLIGRSFESVLDVGCGKEKLLRPYFPSHIEYRGIDLIGGETQFDLEKGLPILQDNSYDIVFTLDVLEHLENAHFVFQELLRVARKEVIISLPNMYYWVRRFRYFGGKTLEQSYFYPEATPDRHRWIPSYNSAVELIKENSGGHKVEVGYHLYDYNKRKFMFGGYVLRFLEGLLARRWPNLFVYGIVFKIEV